MRRRGSGVLLLRIDFCLERGFIPASGVPGFSLLILTLNIVIDFAGTLTPGVWHIYGPPSAMGFGRACPLVRVSGGFAFAFTVIGVYPDYPGTL